MEVQRLNRETKQVWTQTHNSETDRICKSSCTRGPEAGLHVKTNVYERGQAERQKCEEQAEMSRQADGCNTEAEPIWERVNGAWVSV